MDDRELLEKAARAVGMTPTGAYFEDYEDTEWIGPICGIEVDEHGGPWNPLEDDGDAFRLMVDASIEVSVSQEFGVIDAGPEAWSITENYDGGCYRASTRRAIVRAAAAMAKEG